MNKKTSRIRRVLMRRWIVINGLRRFPIAFSFNLQRIATQTESTEIFSRQRRQPLFLVTQLINLVASHVFVN